MEKLIEEKKVVKKKIVLTRLKFPGRFGAGDVPNVVEIRNGDGHRLRSLVLVVNVFSLSA